MRTGFGSSPQVRPWQGPARGPAAQADPRQDRSGRLRRRAAAVVDEVAELLGRSVVYVLAMLGLLHLLGLVAASP